ncbi:MAG: tRNA (adenosine(37)-N6)-threonylcarbamoyltransferase complex ATPase subunit type 1 TsaE [Coriobacteriales bacterium]|jgi:tRNA threonylcarbamoyladenosine biosynthesis protein TsaE|nr:tRNA (adenosine(37)-N6)-threonylcarbamoyltransferase complex ATPase subunit type 1 TsaE [Coriobacteriales bacterium]
MTLALQLASHSEAQTQQLGASLGALLEPGSVVILSGDLGAGKTQFTKGIARALGIVEPITSPTFNILLQHEVGQSAVLGRSQESGREQGGASSVPSHPPAADTPVSLYHFDLYRLESEGELDDIDYFGLLEQDAASVVEWGDKFPGALPVDYLQVDFELQANDARILHGTAHGSQSERLLAAWSAAACYNDEAAHAQVLEAPL